MEPKLLHPHPVRHATTFLQEYPPDKDEGWLWFWCVGLRAEYKLFPLACLAIIPIGISACELSGSYMRAGERDPPNVSWMIVVTIGRAKL